MHTDRCGNTCGQKCCAKYNIYNINIKICKYKYKIQNFMYSDRGMESMKCVIAPVITGATGIITKCLKKNLEAGPVKHSTDSLKNTVICGTSQIIFNNNNNNNDDNVIIIIIII